MNINQQHHSPSHSSITRRVIQSFCSTIQTRIMLLSLEWAEEKQRLIIKTIFCFATFFFILFTFFLLNGLILLFFWEDYQLNALLYMVLFYGVISLLCFFKTRSLFHHSPKSFEVTREELKKDLAYFKENNSD